MTLPVVHVFVDGAPITLNQSFPKALRSITGPPIQTLNGETVTPGQNYLSDPLAPLGTYGRTKEPPNARQDIHYDHWLYGDPNGE